MAAKPKTYKFPKTMGACADHLYQLREERLKAQKLITDMEEEEKALRQHIIATIPKEDTGASGKLARVSRVTKKIPIVEDWDAFYKYVIKNKAFDLLQRRLSDAAVAERWNNKKKVAGVGTFDVVSLSVNKV